MPNLSDDTVQPEIYILIAHFLNNGPLSEVGRKLIEELEKRHLIPNRLDWTGAQHSRQFSELSHDLNFIPSNFILQSFNQLRHLLDSSLNVNLTRTNTLLGTGQFSLLQDLDKRKQNTALNSNPDAIPKDFFLRYRTNNKYNFNYSSRFNNVGTNLIFNLTKNQLTGRLDTSSVIQPDLFRSITSHKRILGHLSAVYCVCFDRTGRYILTGADDNLIKIWCASGSRLLATLRGHEKEISDIDINFENTLVASGSCDKSIRIWNLKTTECTTVLQGHNSMVTSIEFSPMCRGSARWLASSGNDGVICFWSWDSKTLAFNPRPKKFIEKSRPSGQILCISFSAGGSFLVAGSNDHAIRVYFFDNNDPIKIGELESHSNLVDSIQYANNSARFLSGSKDGTARIWKYESQKWKAIVIDVSKTLKKQEPDDNTISLMDINKKHSVTMVTWNNDDTLVVTAQNNYLIKVWNSNDASLVHELKGHTDEVFVLEAHPRDPRLLLSAGHDGNIILWNLFTGKMIKKFYNRIENEGHGCLFDTKWSPTSDMFASTDSHGYLTMFGFGNDDKYKRIPNELFFHTDYRPLMRDSNEFVVDEQTQQPPHLMQPPFLVNADGNPYDLEFQRLVPGRENLTDAQLNPHVITNERGMPEIIGENAEMDDENQTNQARSRGTFWYRDLIRPLNAIDLRTNEEKRLAMLEAEEDYFIPEYRKELKANELKGNKTIDFKSKTSNFRRGRKSKANLDSLNSKLEVTIRNRLTAKALYDTDNEDEATSHSRPAVHSEYDEETLDDPYIDIDDDSNTQHSIGAGVSSSSNHATTSAAAHAATTTTTTTSTAAIPTTSASTFTPTASANSNGPFTSRSLNTNRSNANIYYNDQDLDMASENTESSEYSDWAEEDGRRTLKPPPSRAKKSSRTTASTSRSKRTLRVLDDDEEEDHNENTNTVDVDEATNNSIDSTPKTKKTSASKKLKKIVSDDDDHDDENSRCVTSKTLDENDEEENEDEEDEDDEDEYDEDEDEYSSGVDDAQDADKPCTSHAANTRSKSKRHKRKLKSKSNKNSKLTRTTSNHTFSNRFNVSNSSSVNNKSVSFSKKSDKHARAKVKQPVLLKECPPEYRPPEWLTSTKPKKSPYVPQIGDEVVYFRQGHELYANAVKLYKVYDLDESSLPWHTHDLSVQEYCKVIGMKVEIRPPRLVCLKLGVMDPASGKVTSTKFSIKFHDMAHVVDFVILRQFYERAIEKHWRPKDRFRCIIDDVWWMGVIETRKPFQDEYPDSHFQCLQITWDNGESEQLSPWDLEPVCGTNARKSKQAPAAVVNTSGEGLPVTGEELKSLLYLPDEDEWPAEGRDAECERILRGLEKIMELSLAEHFNYPVDLDSFPNYAMIIEYPIDLSTIRERLENRFYRRINSIQWDVRKIELNAVRYNEPKSNIVRKGALLCELLLEFISDPHCTNPIPIYKRLCQSKYLTISEETSVSAALLNTTDSQYFNSRRKSRNSHITYDENGGDLEEEMEQEISDEDNHASGKRHSKRSSNQQVSKKSSAASSVSAANTSGSRNDLKRRIKKSTWQENCKKLISDLIEHPDGAPFISPVDLNDYPDYLSVIDTPMDLSTIQANLESNKYGERLNKFDSDCKLIFLNSKAYNTNKRSKIYGMTLRLQSYYDNRIAEIIKEQKSFAQAEAQAAKHDKRKTRQMDKAIASTNRANTSTDQPTTSNFSNTSSRKPRLQNLNNSDLYDDQLNNTTLNGIISGMSTRSSKTKSRTTNDANFQQMIKSEHQTHSQSESQTGSSKHLLDKVFLDDSSHILNHNIDDIEYDIISETNNNNNKLDQESAPRKADEPCTSKQYEFKVEHSQNANMSFNNDEEYQIEEKNASTDQDATYSFNGQINSKIKEENKELNESDTRLSYERHNGAEESHKTNHLDKTSELDDTSEIKKSGKHGKKRSRKKKCIDETSSEEDDDEEYTIEEKPKVNMKMDKKIYDDENDEYEEDDLDDEDYDDEEDDYEEEKNKNKKTKSGDLTHKKGKKGRPRLHKNLDNKENDNEYNTTNNTASDNEIPIRINKKQIKIEPTDSVAATSSSSSSRNKRSSKRSRSQRFSYKELMTSSSNVSSANELDDSSETNNKNNRKNKLNRSSKKRRRFSSSPTTRNETEEEEEVEGVEEEGSNVSSDEETSSHKRSTRASVASSSAGCSSRLSSRGRLLKTVSQY